MSALSNDLAKLSSAEDFFAYFDVDFDTRVMAASRLHILKRFHDNLSLVGELELLDDDKKRCIYRAELVRAYTDFAASSALAQRVFPGLRHARGAFVALSSLRLPNKAAPHAKS